MDDNIHQDDKFIDIHNLDNRLERKIERLKTDPKLSEHNRQIILRYLRESELGKTIRKGQKKTIGAGRNLQVAGYLSKMSNEWFKKDLDKVSMADMENFIYEMEKGKIMTQYNKPMTAETKANVKNFLRKFYKWLLGENKVYPDIVEWIDTSKKQAMIEAVPGLDKGIWRIIEIIPDIKRKAAILALFDSGFREGEFINCRIRDLEKNQDGVYYLTCRYSKTKPRTVSLPYSSELIDRWLEMHPDRKNPNAQLWQLSRPMLVKTMRIYSKNALGKRYTVHQIRHTSATFWAPKLDRVAFCKKFGWSYSSNVPDRYIDFAKVNENKVIDIVKAEKYTELSRKVEEQTILNQQLKEQLAELTEKVRLINSYAKVRKNYPE